MYTPARVWSQQNQDSKFRMGVLHILVGPLRARDGRRRPHALRHLRAAGVEAVPARADDPPELLGLQRRGARLFRGRRDRRARAEGRHHHARSGAPRFPGGRPQPRSPTPIMRAAAKGFYVIRDFAPGKPRHGYVVTQGSSSTVNLVSVAAEARSGRHQREGDRRDQRGTVRPPAGGVSPLRAAAGGATTT